MILSISGASLLDNPVQASIFIEKLQEKFVPLLSHPEMGAKREHLAPGLRAHFFRDYVIYYMIDDSEIIIVRVLHGSRDVEAIFTQYEDSPG